MMFRIEISVYTYRPSFDALNHIHLKILSANILNSNSERITVLFFHFQLFDVEIDIGIFYMLAYW